MAGRVCPAWGSFLFAENWFIPQSGRHTLFPKLCDLIGIECFKPFLAGFSPSWPFHFSCLPNLDPSAKSCPAPAPRPRSVVTMYHSAEKVFLPGMPPDTHNTHSQSPPPELQGLLRNLQPHQSTFLRITPHSHHLFCILIPLNLLSAPEGRRAGSAGPCVLTVPCLLNHASVTGRAKGLPQRKSLLLQAVEGLLAHHSQPREVSGRGWPVIHMGNSTALAGTFRGYVSLCISCQFRSGLAARRVVKK